VEQRVLNGIATRVSELHAQLVILRFRSASVISTFNIYV